MAKIRNPEAVLRELRAKDTYHSVCVPGTRITAQNIDSLTERHGYFLAIEWKSVEWTKTEIGERRTMRALVRQPNWRVLFVQYHPQTLEVIAILRWEDKKLLGSSSEDLLNLRNEWFNAVNKLPNFLDRYPRRVLTL
jgi:hypothetical protein